MTIGQAVNEVVKARLKTLGATGRTRLIKQFANLLARDIVKVMQNNGNPHVVQQIVEGFNGKGPTWF